MWQDNAALRALLEEYYVPQQRYLHVAVPGALATVKLFLPPQLNLENPDGAKYPMVVNIYTGPNSARVTDNFGLCESHSLFLLVISPLFSQLSLLP